MGLIRKARIADVGEVRKILRLFAAKGELLARTMAELYSQVRDYYVYQDNDQSPIIGVSALHVCWESLGELRSVAVLEQSQGKGVGTRLVETCLSEAITLGLEQVFVLTYRPDFLPVWASRWWTKISCRILFGPTAYAAPNFLNVMKLPCS